MANMHSTDICYQITATGNGAGGVAPAGQPARGGRE